jgi:DNA-binding NarL/FixJ family response regulator
MKNILIIEDNYLMRFSLKSIIDGCNKYIVDTACDGNETLNIIKEKKFDLLLVDIQLPDINGIDLAKQILKKIPSQKILFITGLDHNKYLNQVIETQNNGFILKDIEPEDLKFAIEYVIKGGYFYGNQILKDFFEKLKEKYSYKKQTINNNNIEKQLTPREMQIAKYISEGLTSVKIGEKMFLSKRTIDSHRHNLLKKLNLNNSSELVALITSKN